MNRQLVTLSMLTLAGTASAQFSSQNAGAPLQRQTQPVATPGMAFLVGGSDNCATPDLITGTGSFAFDNGLATTGTQGQSTVNCIQFNQIAVASDVWFAWTAPQTGTVVMSTCGSTVDTKIAAYAGTTCPAAGATALGCNDDFSPYTLQSQITFNVTAGQQVLLQVGVFPGPPPSAGGPGNFTLEYQSATCTYDDGSTEDAIGLTAGGEVAWLQSFGSATGATTVSGVTTAYGAVGGTPPAAGTPSVVAIWDDPNDDGDPSDLVLLATAPSTIQNPGTDTFFTTNFTTPVTVNGVYFIGVKTTNAANQFVTPLDGDGCGYRAGVAFIAGQPGGVLDLNNMNGAGVPPTTADSVGFGGVWLLRGECAPAQPGIAYCFGDGSGTACPCGNASAVGANTGCLNSLSIGGKLTTSGIASIAADTLQLNGAQMPNNSVLYFQGTTRLNAGNGVVFGDGLRCVGGSVIRLGTTTNVGGASTYPFGAMPKISIKGNITTAVTRQYQAWYRNPAAFCTASVFNLTNGWEVVWTP